MILTFTILLFNILCLILKLWWLDFPVYLSKFHLFMTICSQIFSRSDTSTFLFTWLREWYWTTSQLQSTSSARRRLDRKLQQKATKIQHYFSWCCSFLRRDFCIRKLMSLTLKRVTLERSESEVFFFEFNEMIPFYITDETIRHYLLQRFTTRHIWINVTLRMLNSPK